MMVLVAPRTPPSTQKHTLTHTLILHLILAHSFRYLWVVGGGEWQLCYYYFFSGMPGNI